MEINKYNAVGIIYIRAGWSEITQCVSFAVYDTNHTGGVYVRDFRYVESQYPFKYVSDK